MKITRATTYIVGNPWKNWLFLRLDTDQPGLYGVGEGSLNGFAKTIEAAIEELAPFYEGMDPFQIETIYQRMYRDLYSDGGQIHMNAVAAVEMACWDIIGKETGRPIYDLLGGRYHESLPAYANGWYQGPREIESFAERALEVVSRGYQALKFDPFGAAWRTMTPADRRLSIDIVGAVRDAVGDDVQIMVEGHRRFSVAEAVTIASEIEQFKPTWFEEPTDHTKIDATVEVARHTNVPISCGESFTTPHQFAELLKYNAVHILQPDPCYLGGILKTRFVCAMADASYAAVAPHQSQGPIATAACVQIGACTPNLLTQELFDEYNVEWERDLVTNPVEVVDGRIQIPLGPGLGTDLNWSELEKHPYQTDNFLPLVSTRLGAQGRDPRVKLHGCIPIVATPFSPDGAIDYIGLEKEVDWLIREGAAGLATLAIASEGYKLTEAERDTVATLVVATANHRVPVVVSVDGGSPEVALDRVKRAVLHGADALMVLPPYFVKPDQQGLFDYYQAIGQAAQVPVMIQDAPQVTGVAMGPSLWAELAEKVDSIRYIKAEGMPQGTTISATLQLSDKLEVFCGWGGVGLFDALDRGASGSMPAPNFTGMFVECQKLYEKGKRGAAEKRFAKDLPFLTWSIQSVDHSVAAAKEELRQRRIFTSSFQRQPKVPLDQVAMEQLNGFLRSRIL